MQILRKCVLFSFLIGAVAVAQTSDDLFNPAVLQEIRLFMHPADWQTMKNNPNENTYYPCELEWGNQIVFDVGIRQRGGGSRSGTKPGLRVDMNRYIADQEFLGLKSIVLDNLVQDPTMMRERVAMGLFARMGIPAPREAYTRLSVNGEYAGLYLVVEAIDKNFLKRHFSENDGYLYDYEWSEEYRFEYKGDDPFAYSPVPFEPQTNENRPDPAPL